MGAVMDVGSGGFWNPGHSKFKAFDFAGGKACFQKNDVTSQKMNPDMVKTLRQLRESIDVRLDYKVDSDGEKVSVKVINDVSGKVIRENSL